MTVIRTEDQKADDRENLRENVRRITEELEIAGIPYDRILREYEAAIYVPNIEENQVMVAMVGLKGAIPMQLCRRDVTGFRGGQYQSTDSVDEAVRLVKAWMRPSCGRTIRAKSKATSADRSVYASSGAVSGRSEVEGKPLKKRKANGVS